MSLVCVSLTEKAKFGVMPYANQLLLAYLLLLHGADAHPLLIACPQLRTNYIHVRCFQYAFHVSYAPDAYIRIWDLFQLNPISYTPLLFKYQTYT